MTQLALPSGVRLVQPPERPFTVLESSLTLILDWDIESEVTLTPLPTKNPTPTLTEAPPYVNVESGCCTISCTQDAIDKLEAYAELCGDQL